MKVVQYREGHRAVEHLFSRMDTPSAIPRTRTSVAEIGIKQKGRVVSAELDPGSGIGQHCVRRVTEQYTELRTTLRNKAQRYRQCSGEASRGGLPSLRQKQLATPPAEQQPARNRFSTMQVDLESSF